MNLPGATPTVGCRDTAPALSRVATPLPAVGSWEPLDSQLTAVTPAEERLRLTVPNVGSEIYQTLIGADGSLVAPDFAKRCIAIDSEPRETRAQPADVHRGRVRRRGLAASEELRRIPCVIVATAGTRKRRAARVVRRAGLVTGVVTAREIAEALLDAREITPRQDPLYRQLRMTGAFAVAA